MISTDQFGKLEARIPRKVQSIQLIVIIPVIIIGAAIGSYFTTYIYFSFFGFMIWYMIYYLPVFYIANVSRLIYLHEKGMKFPCFDQDVFSLFQQVAFEYHTIHSLTIGKTFLKIMRNDQEYVFSLDTLKIHHFKKLRKELKIRCAEHCDILNE